MTGSAMKDMVMNGDIIMQPVLCTISCSIIVRKAISWPFNGVISPAMGRGMSFISLALTTTSPPPISMTRLTARTMYVSLEPMATMLWQSWATEPAMAPWVMPKPRIRPTLGLLLAGNGYIPLSSAPQAKDMFR